MSYVSIDKSRKLFYSSSRWQVSLRQYLSYPGIKSKTDTNYLCPSDVKTWQYWHSQKRGWILDTRLSVTCNQEHPTTTTTTITISPVKLTTAEIPDKNSQPKPKNPLLDKNTKLVLFIIVAATVAVSIVSTCLVIFCYHKCKKSQEVVVQMEDFHGELNETYGTYYDVQGERMIESEFQDTNEYYEEAGEQEETGSTMITDTNPDYE